MSTTEPTVISHTHEHGTIITGTTQGDGIYAVARQHGFRYSHLIGIYIRGSRDHIAPRARMRACAAALSSAGYSTMVIIDDEPRPRAVVLAAQAERLDDRQEALDAKTARRTAETDRLREAGDALTRGRPPGQPLLADHHSFARESRRLQLSQDYAFRALDAAELADETRRRADAVGWAAEYSASPEATALRIARLEVEQRDLGRRLDAVFGSGGDVEQSLQARDKQVRLILEYDRMALARAIESGAWTPWGPDTVQVGDLVSNRSVGNDYRLVLRVNKKSVSVNTGYSWTDTMAYVAIRRHCRPEPDKAAAAVKAALAIMAERKAAIAGYGAR